jgi:hypothetical protein
MIEARDAVSIDTVLKQIQQLRSGAPAASQTAATAAAPAAKAAPVPAPAPAAVQAPLIAAVPGQTDLPQLWEGLVEAVGRASPFVKSYFLEAHPVSFVKNILTIGFDPEFADHLTLVDNAKNHALVETKLAELGHPHARVKFIRAEAPPREKAADPAPLPPSAANLILAAEPVKLGPAPAPVPAPAPSNKDDFKNDPLIQKALEIFKGQIVEVRS